MCSSNIFLAKTDVAKAKAEITKWMFIFWIEEMAATMAIVKFLM